MPVADGSGGAELLEWAVEVDAYVVLVDLLSAFVGLFEHKAVFNVCQQCFWPYRRQSDRDSTCALAEYSSLVLLLSPSVFHLWEGHPAVGSCGHRN